VLRGIVSQPSGKDLILQDANNLSFKGRVDSIFYDRSNHNKKMVILSSGYIYSVFDDSDYEIEVGDSLFKSEGNLKIEVFKPNGAKGVLDYRSIIKKYR